MTLSVGMELRLSFGPRQYPGAAAIHADASSLKRKNGGVEGGNQDAPRFLLDRMTILAASPFPSVRELGE